MRGVLSLYSVQTSATQIRSNRRRIRVRPGRDIIGENGMLRVRPPQFSTRYFVSSLTLGTLSYTSRRFLRYCISSMMKLISPYGMRVVIFCKPISSLASLGVTECQGSMILGNRLGMVHGSSEVARDGHASPAPRYSIWVL